MQIKPEQCNRLSTMTELYKLIPEISPNQHNWQAKFIVAEKMSPRQAKHGNSRYQNMVLMDLQENKVHATLYDANIQAFKSKLLLAKTYSISNALVKDTKPEYRSFTGEFQWTISGKTKVEEIDEDNMEFLFSTYTITPFNQLEGFMDSNTEITILAAAIDMRPKRLIQTRYGSQAYVQDILLIDRSFHTIILTMWDSFIDSKCTILAENLLKKPIILATQLKVSSFNGLTLSTKTTSGFFIDVPFQQVAIFRRWVNSNIEQLNEIAHEMHHFTVSPAKPSPPSSKKITPIQNLKGRILGEKNTYQDRMVSIIEDEHVFYLKVTQLELNTAQYKYEIIFALDFLPPVGETSAKLTGSPKKLLFVAETDENTNTCDIQPPSTKRILFQPSTDTQQQIVQSQCIALCIAFYGQKISQATN